MHRFGWLMGRRLRHFNVAELPAAMRWAAGDRFVRSHKHPPGSSL